MAFFNNYLDTYVHCNICYSIKEKEKKMFTKKVVLTTTIILMGASTVFGASIKGNIVFEGEVPQCTLWETFLKRQELTQKWTVKLPILLP